MANNDIQRAVFHWSNVLSFDENDGGVGRINSDIRNVARVPCHKNRWRFCPGKRSDDNAELPDKCQAVASNATISGM